MPSVVNGCGTWYYGKNRVHRISMTCPNCGGYAGLESYDTTKYVVFLFVPLVPISKWRVLEKCPACSKHRAIKMKDWETAKQADSAAVTEELRKDPTNPETVQKVIGVATAYQDENLFLQVAEKLAKPMKGNSEVQATLGAAYAYFARRDQAEEAYKASLAVKGDPEVSEQLALQLLRQGRPEEAEKYLHHALTSDKPEQAGFVHLLGEGYLAAGQHIRGIELLDQAATMEPAIKADKQHQKLRKKAEKTQSSGKPIPAPLLTSEKNAGYEEGGVGGNIAKWVGPLVAAALLAFYLSMAWGRGRSREVHVVNGLDVPYTANIAGEVVDLPPRVRRTIKVPEGTLHVTAQAGERPVIDTDVSVKTSFLTRPFVSRTFVINPDRTALLGWEKNFYAENANDAPEPEYELFVGEPVYEFKGLDYEFEPFPNQLKSSGKGTISKTRVEVVGPNEASDTDLLFLLPQLLSEEQYRAYLETRARFSPDNEKWVLMLQSVMPGEEYLGFLKEGLADRPPQVHWHRAYQSMMEKLHPEHDLSAEYEGYLTADPTNPTLQYLAGRASQDLNKSLELFRQAAQADPPSAYAANALAFQYLSEGKFEEAAPWSARALAGDPESLTISGIDRTIKLATGRIDELIAQSEATNDPSLGGLMHVNQTVEFLGHSGRGEEARANIDAYFRTQSAQGDATFAATMRDAMLASLAYAEGDTDAFMEFHAGDSEPSFDVLFVRGDLDGAADLLAKAESTEVESASHLALSLKAHASGEQELAESQLALGIAKLQEGTHEERIFAEALGAEGTSDPDQLLRLPVLPEDKRIILTVLGVRYPDDREAYFGLARQLNFDREVPWAFLRDFLGRE